MPLITDLRTRQRKGKHFSKLQADFFNANNKKTLEFQGLFCCHHISFSILRHTIISNIVHDKKEEIEYEH